MFGRLSNTGILLTVDDETRMRSVVSLKNYNLVPFLISLDGENTAKAPFCSGGFFLNPWKKI